MVTLSFAEKLQYVALVLFNSTVLLLVSAVGRFSVNRKTTQRKDSVLKINSASLQQWVVWVVLGPLGRFSVRPICFLSIF